MMETDQPSKCADLREDYFECLHHRKEVSFPFFPRRSDPPAQGQLGLQVPADADAGLLTHALLRFVRDPCLLSRTDRPPQPNREGVGKAGGRGNVSHRDHRDQSHVTAGARRVWAGHEAERAATSPRGQEIGPEASLRVFI